MCRVSLYIWDLSPLSYFFALQIALPFDFPMASSNEQKFIILMKSNVSVCFFPLRLVLLCFVQEIFAYPKFMEILLSVVI